MASLCHCKKSLNFNWTVEVRWATSNWQRTSFSSHNKTLKLTKMLKQKPMSVRDSRYRRSRWGQSSRLLKSLLRRNCEKNVFVLILGWKRRGLIGDDDVKFWMNRNIGNEMIAPKTVNDQSEYVKRNKANAGNLSPQRLALQRFALPRKRHTLPYRGNVSYVALSRTEQTAMGEYLGNVYDWRVRVKWPVYVVFGWRTSGGRVSYSRDKVMCKKMSSIAHWSFFLFKNDVTTLYSVFQ